MERGWAIGLLALWASAAFAVVADSSISPGVAGAGAPTPIAVESLARFSAADGMRGWLFKQVVAEPVADGMVRLHYPTWNWWRGKWPAIMLDYGKGGFDEADWSRYDRLVFALFGENETPAVLKLRLDDGEGRRAIRSFLIPSGERQVCRVAIAGLAGEIDVSQVVHFDLYMSQPATDYSFLLEEIRLEADPLSLDQVRFQIDPFGGGRIRVRAASGRRGLYAVKVLDGTGKEAAVHRDSTAKLDWRWTGGEAGKYRVEMEVRDPNWGGQTERRALGRFTVSPEEGRPQTVVWSEPSTRKVMLDDRPRQGQGFSSWEELVSGSGEPLRIDVARNEYAAAQLVVLTRRDSASFRFAIEGLRREGTEAELSPEELDFYQVGYLFTQRPEGYAVGFSGWWPDPLLPVERMVAVAGECMPVWISLKVGEETEPGVYRGGLVIRRADGNRGRLPFEVRVHRAAVPDSSRLRTAFSLYDDMLDRVYGEGLSRRLYRRYQRFVSEHRLNVDHLYRSSPPRLSDLRYFANRGRLNAFNLIYLKAGGDYSPKGLEEIAVALDPYVEELRRQGLVERAYLYGFDEAEVEEFGEMKRVFTWFKRRYPDLKMATTARDPSLGGLDESLDEAVDIWVPLTAGFDRRTAAQAREKGDEVWWYICISPPHPHANWFIEYPAIEARLLWWMSWRERVDGFLYYALNRWPHARAPMRFSGRNRIDWNPASFETANGDGCLLYPGLEGPISTIRLENVRDGLEDYELLHQLGAEGADALCARLIESLVDYSRDVEEFARVRLELLERLEAGVGR